MKQLYVFITLIFIFTINIFAQNSNVITVSQMGPFKLWSTPKQLTSALGIKIKEPSFNKEGYYTGWDTANVVYKNASYQLIFLVEKTDSGTLKSSLYRVRSKNTTMKTQNGIGIGSSKKQILITYDKCSLSINNSFDNADKFPKDKVQYITVKVDEEDYGVIVFTTEDRVVTEIEVYYSHNECC